MDDSLEFRRRKKVEKRRFKDGRKDSHHRKAGVKGSRWVPEWQIDYRRRSHLRTNSRKLAAKEKASRLVEWIEEDMSDLTQSKGHISWDEDTRDDFDYLYWNYGYRRPISLSLWDYYFLDLLLQRTARQETTYILQSQGPCTLCGGDCIEIMKKEIQREEELDEDEYLFMNE